MAIIRNYNDIKSILTEKYIIREKEEKGFFKSKKVYVEELEFKRKDIYDNGELISFEEIDKITNTNIKKTYGNKSKDENGEFFWTIKEYYDGELKKISIRYLNNNGDCYKEFVEDYSLNNKYSYTYKLQYNQLNLENRKEARVVETSIGKHKEYLSYTIEKEYDVNNRCTKMRWKDYDSNNGQLLNIHEFSYTYNNNGYCIKKIETVNTISNSDDNMKEKGIKTIYTENSTFNHLGDCIYREGTHYTQHFKFNFDYKYDLHNNCTEYRNTITINGNFDSEVVYRYEINYK